MIDPMDGPMARPHITMNAFFSAVCGQIDLKFGRDLHFDQLLHLLFFFFLNSSFNSFFSSFSSFSSSEIKLTKIIT
jgi:hypothetical protein